MRLYLDNNTNAAAAADTNLNAPVAATGRSATGLNTSGTVTSDPASRDSVAVSTASSAWSASFSDRAARVSQLTAAFQGGTYNVPSAAISQSIVASATA